MIFLGQTALVNTWRIATLVFVSSLLFFGITNAVKADAVNTAQYLDADGNGTVEKIRWTMDVTVTSCTYEAGDWTVDTASELNIAITGVSCTGADAFIDIAVTADAGETGHTTAPVISYTDQGTTGSIVLTGPANMTSKPSVTITDGAAPVIKTIRYLDNGSNPGKFAAVLLILTETADATSTISASNLLLTNVGDFTSAEFGSATADAIVVNTALPSITLGTASSVLDTYDDSGNLAFSLQGTFNLTDGTNTNSTTGAQTQATIEDDIEPRISTFTYKDADGDGKIDRITLGFTETITASSTLSANDLTLTNVGDFTGASFGSNSTDLVSSSVSSVDIDLGTEATAVDTAEGSGNIAISSQNSFNIQDAAFNQYQTDEAQTLATFVDGAAPVVASVSPSEGSTSANTSADLTITFSEPMDTTFAEGTEFSISPDPGSFSASWASSNTVLTLATPTLLCSTEYTVTTDNTQIAASAGTPTQLATTGPSDGDWTFTTSCGSGSSSSTVTPSNIDITYTGPVCTTENTHNFTLSADNAVEYLVADNDQFIGTDWVTFTDGMSVSSIFNPGETAYFRFQSSTATQSNTFNITLNDWATTCAGNEPAEEEPTTEEPTEEEPTVTPVAGVSPGDLIVSSSSTAVYYVTETYGRRVFINEATYFTWFDSFDAVKQVSEDTLAALPIEGNMLPKAGVVLVKIQSVVDVYALSDDNEDLVPELRLIEDEAMATALYGSLWADYVIDIEPTFFTKFESGDPMTSTEDIDTSIMKRRVDL